MAINKEWHEKNKMPKNPSEEQRIKWHIAHAKNCSCRQPSAKLLGQMKKMGFVVAKMRRKSLADK
jgi:hypothetical protein